MSLVKLGYIHKVAVALNYNTFKNASVNKDTINDIIDTVFTASDDVDKSKLKEGKEKLLCYLTYTVDQIKNIKTLETEFSFPAKLLADILIYYDIKYLEQAFYNKYENSNTDSLYNSVFNKGLNSIIDSINPLYTYNTSNDNSEVEAQNVIDRFYSIADMDYSSIIGLCSFIKQHTEIQEKFKNDKIEVPQEFISYLETNAAENEEVKATLNICTQIVSDSIPLPEFVLYRFIDKFTRTYLPTTQETGNIEAIKNLLYIVNNVLEEQKNINNALFIPVASDIYAIISSKKTLFENCFEFYNFKNLDIDILYKYINLPDTLKYMSILSLHN